MKAMQKHQVNEMLLGLGALCFTGDKGGKGKAPVRDVSARRYAAFASGHLSNQTIFLFPQTGTKKSRRQKPRKKKKDRDIIEDSIRRVRSLSNYLSLLLAIGHELTFCGCGQMCTSMSSTAPSWREEASADLAIPAELHSSSVAVTGQELHQYEGNHMGALDALNTKGGSPRTPEASATEPRSRASSPQARSPPIAFPSVISTPETHQSLSFTSGDGPAHTFNCRPSSHIGSIETLTRSDEEKPLISGADCTDNASGEGVDRSEGVKCDSSPPTTEGRHDKNELRTHTDAIGPAGLDATPLVVAEGMIARVGDEARLPSGLVHPGTHIPGFPYDLDTGASQVRMQGGFLMPMDEDEVESEPSFGVLSNTTFDPLLVNQPQPHYQPHYQPHSNSHYFNIEQDDLIVEDIEPEFVADLAMEDAGMWKAEASVTTEARQPFSWMPASVSDAFHSIFPDIPSTQMTAFVHPAMHVLEPSMLSDPYAMCPTIPEGARLQQVAPPQDTPCQFASDGTHPSPSVGSELFNGLEYIVPTLSTIYASNVSVHQTTSRPWFTPTSPHVSRAGPIPVPPSPRGYIVTHTEEVVDFDEEMGPKLGVATNVQHETSPLRCESTSESMWALTESTHYRSPDMHKAIDLDDPESQRCTRSSVVKSSGSLPQSFCSFILDTTVNHSALTSALPIAQNEDKVEDKESKDYTKDGAWYVIYAVSLFSLRSLEHCFCREGVHEMVGPSLAMAQPTTKEPSSPLVPPRIVGSKRKYVEDPSTYCNSINPPRKKSKLPCVLYFTMIYLDC